jgi:hypothetical protein
VIRPRRHGGSGCISASLRGHRDHEHATLLVEGGIHLGLVTLPSLAVVAHDPPTLPTAPAIAQQALA